MKVVGKSRVFQRTGCSRELGKAMMRICDLHVGHSLVHGTFDTIIYLLLQTDDCCCWDTFETPMMLTGKYGVLAKGSTS